MRNLKLLFATVLLVAGVSFAVSMMSKGNRIQCYELCDFNGGVKFYDPSAEYECECGSGVIADFDFEVEE